MTRTTAAKTATKNTKRRRGLVLGLGGVALLFALLVTLTALAPESAKDREGSITNPAAAGTKAVAEVLRRNGVGVTQVTTLDAAARRAVADSTLAIWLTGRLSQTAYDRLNAVAADVVLIVAEPYVSLGELTEGRVDAYSAWGAVAGAVGCDDPDALAAGVVQAGQTELEGGPGVELCFMIDSYAGVYADLTTDTHRVTAIASADVFDNDGILSAGHAALALRTLGRHPEVTWYLPGDDAAPGADTTQLSIWGLFPPGFRAVFGLLVLAGLTAALWRGRRLGPLVPEPLPVAVPASEAAAGLGRLYRQAGARGHAAAGLRAGTAHRLAAKLGLPLSAPPEVVSERLGLATGLPATTVQALIFGPPPESDAELVDLAHRLHQLESESSTP
jgi:hypothetical protein